MDRAQFDAEKARDYLLSPTHPVGRFKAAFFASLGYVQADWERLREDLRTLSMSNEARSGAPSPHGAKYEVEGILVGPTGRTARVVAVWIVPNGEALPRFVTAYPG